MGGASLVSRSLGAGDRGQAARAAGTSFTIFWLVAVLTSVLGIAFVEPLLRLLGATDQTLPYAVPYAIVILGGAILSTGFSSIVRAEGRLTFPLLLWVIPVVVQVLLDPLLIFGLHLGVVGAGLGRVGGQAVSAARAVWFFFVRRERAYRIQARDLVPDPGLARRVIAVGTPSLLASFGATILAVVINTTLAAAGAVALAAGARTASTGPGSCRCGPRSATEPARRRWSLASRTRWLASSSQTPRRSAARPPPTPSRSARCWPSGCRWCSASEASARRASGERWPRARRPRRWWPGSSCGPRPAPGLPGPAPDDGLLVGSTAWNTLEQSASGSCSSRPSPAVAASSTGP